MSTPRLEDSGAADRAAAPPDRPAEAPTRGGSRLAAFRYPAYRLFWAGQLAANVGAWMQIVATGWLVLELTDSPAYLGLNAAFQGLPILVTSFVGGVVADRVDRYRLMVGTQFALLVPNAVLAVLVGTGQVHVAHIFAYSLVTAIVNGLTTPARQALVPRLVPQDALLSAVALNSTLWQGGAVLGPTVAGLVLAGGGIAGPFYLNVATDLVSLVLLLLMRLSPVRAPASQRSAWQSLAQGVRYAWRETDVRTLLLVVGALSLLTRPYTQLMPVFARDVFAVGPQGLGLMLTMPAVGAVLAASGLAVAGSLPLARWFLVTATTLGLALAAFAASPVFALSLVLLLIVGAASSASTTLANTLLQQIVDDRVRGRVMGFFMAATWGAWRLGALPTGLLAQVWGAPLAIGLCGTAFLLVLVPVARSRVLRREG